MGSYRSRLDIIADILHVTSRRAKKTQIMYQANLSYRLLSKYLMETKKANLIRFVHKEACYVLTAKGKTYLERYKEYSKSNKTTEKHLSNVNSRKKVLEDLCICK